MTRPRGGGAAGQGDDSPPAPDSQTSPVEFSVLAPTTERLTTQP